VFREQLFCTETVISDCTLDYMQVSEGERNNAMHNVIWKMLVVEEKEEEKEERKRRRKEGEY